MNLRSELVFDSAKGDQGHQGHQPRPAAGNRLWETGVLVCIVNTMPS